MGKAAIKVLINCNFVVLIVVVAVHTGVCLTKKLQLSFYNLPLRLYQVIVIFSQLFSR